MCSNHAAIKAVLFVVLAIFSVVSLFKKDTSNIQATTLGNPVVLECEVDTTKMRITQILEDDQHIYIGCRKTRCPSNLRKSWGVPANGLFLSCRV